jgi:hypothetical protein
MAAMNGVFGGKLSFKKMSAGGRLCTLQENPHFWVPTIKVRPCDGTSRMLTLERIHRMMGSSLQAESFFFFSLNIKPLKICWALRTEFGPSWVSVTDLVGICSSLWCRKLQKS